MGLHLVLLIAAIASAAAWVASLVSGDTSWVDRMWSLLPETYVIVFAATSHWTNARLDVLALLTTLWGVRLTFNFARKGGYRGVEDYRWAVLRASMSRARFQVFNLGFIVLYQNALLVLIAFPAWTLAHHPSHTLSATDIALTTLFVGFLVGETIADQEQWTFHVDKHAREARGERVTPGFCRTGLFRYSRHPNYFFEIAQWWVVFAFAALVAHGSEWLCGLGALLLTGLFVGSTRFTERISASKYPQYASYQREVSAVVPWFPRASSDHASASEGHH